MDDMTFMRLIEDESVPFEMIPEEELYTDADLAQAIRDLGEAENYPWRDSFQKKGYTLLEDIVAFRRKKVETLMERSAHA